MKIKRYVSATEQEAVERIRDELGPDALVMNIKKVQSKGFFGFFRKSLVEVTAAYDDGIKLEPKPETGSRVSPLQGGLKSQGAGFDLEVERLKMSAQIAEKEDKIRMLSDMLLTTGDMLSRAQEQISAGRHYTPERPRIYQNNMLQVFYDTLHNNEVSTHIIREILDDWDNESVAEKIDINFIVKIVYNSLVKMIGSPEGLVARQSKGSPQVFAFVGPTGVGKTTTIAKLTADLCLNRGMDVGLITADTYRIAAIQQLRVYADILGIEIAVAYAPHEIAKHVSDKKDGCDIILIDTAGRSHKNVENMTELKAFVEAVPEIEVFLVLSLATKYEDMARIADVFNEMFDYKIIFTKMDETEKLGAIVNICHKTGKKLSYITFGQNVPDDIKTVSAGEVAMRLLGLEDDM